jgi:hypothetical protein
MAKAVDLEERVEAAMMMPGMRTRLETLAAFRSRMEMEEAEEWRSSWCSGSLRFVFCEG